jgi:hypothetical protein
MQITTFVYTKENDSVSERTVLVLSMPHEHMKCLDMSELTEEQQAMAAVEYGAIMDEHLVKVEAFKKKFDLVKSFRSFDTKKMTQVMSEHV